MLFCASTFNEETGTRIKSPPTPRTPPTETNTAASPDMPELAMRLELADGLVADEGLVVDAGLVADEGLVDDEGLDAEVDDPDVLAERLALAPAGWLRCCASVLENELPNARSTISPMRSPSLS